MSSTTSNSNHSNRVISCGATHPFVNRWIQFVLSNSANREAFVKDWGLLERLPQEEYAIYSHHSKEKSNVISFQVNRKTHPKENPHQHVIHLISQVVKKYCIDSELTLPGFYAFLREIMGIQKQFPGAFECIDTNENRFTEVVNDLITGYWNEVRPNVQDVVYGQSNDMTADMSAIQGIQQISEESHGKQNQLNAQLPFKAVNKIKNEMNNILGSQPTQTPTFSR